MPTLVRLEYLTPTGWALGHAGINLLHPERYVKRLEERGKFGRATELGPDLQPTGQVWVAADLPDPSLLTSSETTIPELAPECPHCDERHRPPHNGSCLL